MSSSDPPTRAWPAERRRLRASPRSPSEWRGAALASHIALNIQACPSVAEIEPSICGIIFSSRNRLISLYFYFVAFSTSSSHPLQLCVDSRPLFDVPPLNVHLASGEIEHILKKKTLSLTFLGLSSAKPGLQRRKVCRRAPLSPAEEWGW